MSSFTTKSAQIQQQFIISWNSFLSFCTNCLGVNWASYFGLEKVKEQMVKMMPLNLLKTIKVQAPTSIIIFSALISNSH